MTLSRLVSTATASEMTTWDVSRLLFPAPAFKNAPMSCFPAAVVASAVPRVAADTRASLSEIYAVHHKRNILNGMQNSNLNGMQGEETYPQ